MPSVGPEQRVEAIRSPLPQISILIDTGFGTTPHAGPCPVRGGIRPVQVHKSCCKGTQLRGIGKVHNIVIGPHRIPGVLLTSDLHVDSLHGPGSEVAHIKSGPGIRVLGNRAPIRQHHVGSVS